jgi:hypothetical protein
MLIRAAFEAAYRAAPDSPRKPTRLQTLTIFPPPPWVSNSCEAWRASRAGDSKLIAKVLRKVASNSASLALQKFIGM